MANNFIKFKGNSVGKSLLEKGSDKIINHIYEHAKKYNCEILTPLDFAVSETKEGTLKDQDKLKENEIILDTGPKTIKKIEGIIDISKTVLWNGPAGYFENIEFCKRNFINCRKDFETLIQVL